MLSIQIAWRYLFGKKTTNAINLITGLSVLGITIGTAALILILSVFNGFEGLLSGLFNAFNPDLRVSPISGKTIVLDSIDLERLYGIDGILEISKTIEEVALFEYKDVQEIGVIKGVDNNYIKVTGMDSLVIHGQFKLKGNSGLNYGVIGVGLRNKLSVNTEDKLNSITVYMPNRSSKFSTKEYTFKDLYPSGIFSVKSENDQKYILSDIDFAYDLLALPKNELSYLEIKTNDNTDEEAIRKELQKIIKQEIKIENRQEQDATFLKIMNIEKWVSFLIVSLTLLLIAFNLIGALWMIILEKRKDIAILKSLGYTDNDIKKLFLSLGIFISLIGIAIGFSIAIFGYFLQKKYGIIGIPEGFLIDAYPIKLKLIDFFRVFFTVIFIGLLASILPALKAAKFGTFLRS
jgi:lipoprotein-releasing system permease protein